MQFNRLVEKIMSVLLEIEKNKKKKEKLTISKRHLRIVRGEY